MKPGDKFKKKFISKFTNLDYVSCTIVEIHEWNVIVQWDNGVISECFKDDIENLYEIVNEANS